MLTIDECKKYLTDYNLTDERIETIRDFLYAFCTEIVRNNIQNYESTITKTGRGK